MHIVVLMKQVPGTSNVKMDENTGTMIRTEHENVMNPLDENALEAALEIRRLRDDVSVVGVSMGPPPAKRVLEEAIAMGADSGVLLSDRGFSGSDTLATAIPLARAAQVICGGRIGPDDLVLCGERATDGETGQVGPMVSSFLGVPVATYVRSIHVGDGYVDVERVVEDGFERLRLSLPAVLTIVKDINQPGFPTLDGKIAARSVKIPVLTLKDLGLSPDHTGLHGSPTRVVRVFRPKFSRDTVLYTQDNSGTATDNLLKFLDSRGLR
jgi:electron transfer flavoprotein beta subunit